MPISFVIPHRMEGKWLGWTVDGIRDQMRPCDEIVTVQDCEGGGVSYARHKGILQATNPIIVTLDAHVKLHKKFCARVEPWLMAMPYAVLCFKTYSINADTSVDESGPKYGATLYEIKNGKPFSNVWRYYPPKLPEHLVPCVLGGCYAFRREWYLDGLMGIWKFHREWGKSEQMLCLMNYLCGGHNICVPDIWAAHYFKRQDKTRPFAVNLNTCRRNWFLIAYGMIPESERNRIFLKLYGEGYVSDYGLPWVEKEVAQISEFLKRNYVRTYFQFREEMLM